MTETLGRRRKAAIIALVVGYYALVLAMLALFAVGAWLAVRELSGRGLPLAALCVLGALAVLRASLLVPDRFEPPGPRVTAREHARLMALIDDVARAVGTAPPDEVYLSADVNAYAGEVGRARRRRVLVLGVGLIDVETVGQLRAAVAHELAHFSARDPVASGFVHRTRQRLKRTAAALEGNLVDLPFLWYARTFLRISAEMSRAQELAADAVALRVAGRDAHIGGLRRVEEALERFQRFQSQVLVGVVAARLWPDNLFDGLRRFAYAEALRGGAPGEPPVTSAEPASHPATDERVRFAEGAQDDDVVEDERPARDLLDDPEACERAVTARAGEVLLRGEALEELAWDAYAERVVRPQLLAAAAEARDEVARMLAWEQADSFAAAARALLEMLQRSAPAESDSSRPAAEAPLRDALRARLTALLAVLLGATLVLRGGAVSAGVGEAVVVHLDGERWDVEALAREAAHRPEVAAEVLAALGLDG